MASQGDAFAQGCLIGGERVVTAAVIPTVDPATGELLANVSAAGIEEVDRAIAIARVAQPSWAARPPRERGQALVALAAALRAADDRFAEVESRDTGKPLKQARADVEVAAQYFEYYGGLADKASGSATPTGGVDLALTVREPKGVTAHIVPWNYPLQISARTVAPSLMAGNACVLKPAELAPLSALALGDLALQAGLLNVVPGHGSIAGSRLVSRDDIDHISFTGGLVVGRQVMHAAAENVKPVTMELGGKSANLVFGDADLSAAVPAITAAVVQNAGQTCSAGARVVVDRVIAEELCARLSESLGAVRIGCGMDDPDLGPLISAAQRDAAIAAVDAAVSRGATAAVGGRVPEDVDLRAGFFMEPTLLTGVSRDDPVAREEIFGPVVVALVVDDEEEAVRTNNDTPFGLITGVWTGDVHRAMRVAQRSACGQVFVNSYGAGGGVGFPFGGVKKSGFGREKGLEAVHEFTNVKTIVLKVAEA